MLFSYVPFGVTVMVLGCPDYLHYPHLFKIVMPIKVDVFRTLLMTHPNQPFIESICKGLTEGFWPWADTKVRIYLDTWDEAMA